MGSVQEHYGFSGDLKAPAMRFEAVTIEGPASIDVIAEVAGFAEEEIRDLNPHLLAGMTPGGGSTVVRLPEGGAAGFAERLALIPPRERVKLHVVTAGETFSHIARGYRISVRELQGANPGIEPRRLQIGSLLSVPGRRADAGGAANTDAGAAEEEEPAADSMEAVSADAGGGAAPVAGPTVHIVTRGESLWLIARLYQIELERLRTHNRIGEGAVVHPGDSIRIPPSS